MKKEKSQKVLLSGIAMVVLFILWTVAISLIDVQPIGPQNSSVGFATLNGFIHSLTGVHMAIYTVTDWLGLIIQTLIRLKNSLISQGRYTDGVDDVLCKVLSTKKRKLKIKYI